MNKELTNINEWFVTYKLCLSVQKTKCSFFDLLYKTMHHLNKKCLLAFCYSYVETYINYANIACGSKHFTNLKKLHSEQKHAIGIVHNNDKIRTFKAPF